MSWVYRAFNVAVTLLRYRAVTTVTTGKFLQPSLVMTHPVMSPNSELRLCKLTIGSEQREWFMVGRSHDPELSMVLRHPHLQTTTL